MFQFQYGLIVIMGITGFSSTPNLFQFQYGLIVIRAESLRLPKHNGFNSNMV
jgi:hypothetical protein